MSTAKAAFFSDLHLSSPDDENTRAFIQRLDILYTDKELTHLFLLGDIFDLWVGPHSYFWNRWKNVVAAVQRFRERGVEVHYFEGNHDLHLKKYWQDKIGCQVHTEARFFKLNGLNLRIEHGDQMDPSDTGYLALRAFLRSPPMTWVAHHLPGSIVQMIGQQASHSSRDYTSNRKTTTENQTREMIERHAQKAYDEQAFEILIAGHVHYKLDKEFQVKTGQRVRLINLGSWLDQPKYLVMNGPHFEWK